MERPTDDVTLRERVEALPVGTLLRLGWRTPSGNVQGSLYLRTRDGLRYCGPERDNWEDVTLRQKTENPRGDDDFEIVASPVPAVRDQGDTPDVPAQIEAWKRALATECIGWIIDDEGKLWPPHDPHQDAERNPNGVRPHIYDGGCALCRSGDNPKALTALLSFLAARRSLSPGGEP